MKYLIGLLFLLFCFKAGITQERASAQSSEDQITFDMNTFKTDKPIPFDRRFTLVIPKFNTTNIKKVFVFEAEYRNGRRDLKIDAISSQNDSTSYYDFEPESNTKKDTLLLYFLPLKPSVEFDLMIVRSLTGKNLQKAYELHEALLANDTTGAKKVFNHLKSGAEYRPRKITYFLYQSFHQYETFFNRNLKSIYQDIQNDTRIQNPTFFNVLEVNRLQTAFRSNELKFLDNNRLIRIINDTFAQKIYKGILPVNYSHSSKEITQLDVEKRVQNIDASITFFDSLYRYTNALLAVNTSTGLDSIRKKADNVLDALANNKKTLSSKLDSINKKIIEDENINEVELLIGSTVAKDLKTKGGNIFTLDAGLSNILVTDAQDKIKYIPKVYWGMNIYFRSIDKNTRREVMPNRYKTQAGAGPDYNIAATKSIWQHLSLTIGLTFGGITNKEFDNFYNNSTLMVGPGYRFGRAFKIGAGAAFLKRASKNPLISDKKVGVGSYVSMSVDIDLIQTLKDFTSILFK